MLTVYGALVALALLFTALAAIGKAPLWVAVFCLVLAELLAIIPAR